MGGEFFEVSGRGTLDYLPGPIKRNVDMVVSLLKIAKNLKR